jgi:hypothetical protein
MLSKPHLKLVYNYKVQGLKVINNKDSKVILVLLLKRVVLQVSSVLLFVLLILIFNKYVAFIFTSNNNVKVF